MNTAAISGQRPRRRSTAAGSAQRDQRQQPGDVPRQQRPGSDQHSDGRPGGALDPVDSPLPDAAQQTHEPYEQDQVDARLGLTSVDMRAGRARTGTRGCSASRPRPGPLRVHGRWSMPEPNSPKLRPRSRSGGRDAEHEGPRAAASRPGPCGEQANGSTSRRQLDRGAR